MKNVIVRAIPIALFTAALFFSQCTPPENNAESDAADEPVQEVQTAEIGDRITDFRANNDKGDVWKFADALGNGYTVVYFYPAAMTGGCTLQACSYRDNSAELEKLGVSVVGISGDSVNNLKIFREAHELNFTLLSDVDGAIAELFGVPLRDGGEITRDIGGIEITMIRSFTTSRWTFILDSEGTIVYKDTEVDAGTDSGAVIEFVKNLS